MQIQLAQKSRNQRSSKMYKDLPLDLHSGDLIDREAIKQAMYNILHIRKGEMPGKPDFGCPIDSYVFEQMDSTLKTLLTSDLNSALSEFEPRINVSGISTEFQEAYNRIDIEIQYKYSGVKTSEYDSLKFSVS